MSYLNKEALNEYLGKHKMYVYEEQMINGELFYRNSKSGAGSMWIKKANTSQQPTGLPGGPQVVTTSGAVKPTSPGGAGDGWWQISPETGEWTWISLGTGSDDTSGSTQSFASGGRTLQEDLDYLAAKYGWDEKLELKVLEKEYELRGHFEDERFKDSKELQKLDAASRLAYLRTEIGLTKTMKLELMREQHEFDKWAQEDQQTWTALESAKDRDFREGESLLNRELEEKLQGLDIESREALAAAQIAATKAIADMNIKSQEGMQVKSFTHAEKMQAGQQAFDKVMQEAGFENDRFLQERELSVRISINAAQIASSELIAQKKIAADKAMQATQIAFDKEQKEEDRKLRRFEEVQKLRGKDPVRAALMAMGAGDALDSFSGSFHDLGPMEGAEQLQADTESALQGIEGLGAAGQTISLGDTGVEGLQSVEKAGHSYVTSASADDATNKILIRSAQGVGGETQAGVSEAQVKARIAAITPQGFENATAAGGVGPHLTPMVRQQYAAEGRGPQINAPRTVATNANRPAVEPNTSYTVGEGQKGDGTRPEVVTTGDNKELLSIEPATNDRGVVSDIHVDTSIPNVKKQGDPLVDMFNDPNLKLDRGEQTLPPMEQGQTPQGIATNLNNDRVIKQQRLGAIKGKLARGEPLTPEEQAEWDAEIKNQANQPRLEPTEQVMSDRRRAYMESLPPAQQAQIRQTQQNQRRTQQEKLVSSLTPDTIQKLMELINNPSRQVNDTLQEQLPQLRDGAGNLRQPQQNLARVV